MSADEQVTSVVSADVADGRSPIRWAFRREPDGPADSGWRLYASSPDGDADIEGEDAVVRLGYEQVIVIEPAMVALWSTPVGADLQFIRPAAADIVVWDNSTDRPFEYTAG
jgi:hypothetical protein